MTASAESTVASTPRSHQVDGSRVVVGAVDGGLLEWGTLQGGYSYSIVVQLHLSGIAADPTRFRVHVEKPKGGCCDLTLASGAVGRAMAGMPLALDLNLAAILPGKFNFKLIIRSEVTNHRKGELLRPNCLQCSEPNSSLPLFLHLGRRELLLDSRAHSRRTHLPHVCSDKDAGEPPIARARISRRHPCASHAPPASWRAS